MNTAELKEALKTHFGGNGAYSVLWEVGNGTGIDCTRHADALVMSIWPSRGLDLIGCELKVSRTDWLKELKNPAKAEAVLQFCDLWLVVAGEDGIVKPDELPPKWGLMVPRAAGGLKMRIQAKPLSPKQIDRSFLAAIFRQVDKQGVDSALLKKAKDDGYKAGYEAKARERGYRDRELEDLENRVSEYEEASGLNIRHGWEGPSKIGRAVKAVLSGELQNFGGLTKARNLAAGFVRDVDALIGHEGGTESES